MLLKCEGQMILKMWMTDFCSDEMNVSKKDWKKICMNNCVKSWKYLILNNFFNFDHDIGM